VQTDEKKRKRLFDEADLAIMYLVQWQLSQYTEWATGRTSEQQWLESRQGQKIILFF
jgi:hypothetical protein